MWDVYAFIHLLVEAGLKIDSSVTGIGLQEALFSLVGDELEREGGGGF